MPPSTRVGNVVVNGTAKIKRAECEVIVLDGKRFTREDLEDILARLDALENA